MCSERTARIKVGNQTASPQNGEKLGSPGVWGTKRLGCKSSLRRTLTIRLPWLDLIPSVVSANGGF